MPLAINLLVDNLVSFCFMSTDIADALYRNMYPCTNCDTKLSYNVRLGTLLFCKSFLVLLVGVVVHTYCERETERSQGGQCVSKKVDN